MLGSLDVVEGNIYCDRSCLSILDNFFGLVFTNFQIPTSNFVKLKKLVAKYIEIENWKALLLSLCRMKGGGGSRTK